MDNLQIGRYIQRLRKTEGLTQKELAQKLNVSFQAVSKWENGDSLPDTALLPDLCDILNTTADRLLNGGSFTAGQRKLMRAEDVISGFQGMVEGIDRKMNIDLLAYLKDPMTREVLYAEVLIQGILSGRTVDMEEIEALFRNKKMVGTIRRYAEKAGNPE